MTASRMSRLTLAVILLILAPYPTIGYLWYPNSNQVTLYDQLSSSSPLSALDMYTGNNRRSPQASQKPSQSPTSTSNVPQRPKNDTAGAQDVKSQRRQKPFRTGSTSSPHAVANLELVVSDFSLCYDIEMTLIPRNNKLFRLGTSMPKLQIFWREKGFYLLRTSRLLRNGTRTTNGTRSKPVNTSWKNGTAIVSTDPGHSRAMQVEELYVITSL